MGCCGSICSGEAPPDEGRELARTQLHAVLPTAASGSVAIEVEGAAASGPSLEQLSWMELPAPGGRLYFFNALTGRTVWTRPDGLLTAPARAALSARSCAADLPRASAACALLGVALALHDPRALDAAFGSLVQGVVPLLADCAFFDHLLERELRLYPAELLRRAGLRRIVIAGNLAFHDQRRRAIPVEDHGILYLDPAPQACYYLQNVFHHELFHLFDRALQAVSLERPAVAAVAAVDALDDTAIRWHVDDNAVPSAAASSSMVAAELLAPEVKAASASAASFQQQRELQRQQQQQQSAAKPLSTVAVATYDAPGSAGRSGAGSLLSGSNGTTTRVVLLNWQTDKVDDRWASLNVRGFVYGRGGAFNRSSNAFLPTTDVKDTDIVPGFLNRYSMSAVEEDKAEIFAGLMRHPRLLLRSSDGIIRAKAQEMRRRLRVFCPLLDEAFWEAVQLAAPLHPAQSLGSWELKTDGQGHPYWFNALTSSISWIPPPVAADSAVGAPLPLIPGSHTGIGLAAV